MDFDIKNSLLKNSVGEQRLSKKGMNTTIDHSMVASTAQKSLNMDLKEEHGNSLAPKNKEKENKKKNQKEENVFFSDDKPGQKTELKIERDPLKLLKLF